MSINPSYDDLKEALERAKREIEALHWIIDEQAKIITNLVRLKPPGTSMRASHIKWERRMNHTEEEFGIISDLGGDKLAKALFDLLNEEDDGETGQTH